MNDELREAIFHILNTVTGLVGYVYYEDAKPGQAYPYAMFFFVDGIGSRDSVSKFEDYYLQINLYHTNGKTLETLVKAVRAALDDKESSFSLTNYFFNRIEWQFTRGLKVDDISQNIIQYKIELTKK